MKISDITKKSCSLHSKYTLLHFYKQSFCFVNNGLNSMSCINFTHFSPPRARKFFSYSIFFQSDLYKKVVNQCNKLNKPLNTVLIRISLKMQKCVFAVITVQNKNASKKKEGKC